MVKKKKMDMGFYLRVVGACVGSIGLFLTAFGRPVIGAVLIGIGGILIAVGQSI
jgi:hypothetical protein